MKKTTVAGYNRTDVWKAGGWRRKETAEVT
jgi:hypothetical protein